MADIRTMEIHNAIEAERVKIAEWMEKIAGEYFGTEKGNAWFAASFYIRHGTYPGASGSFPLKPLALHKEIL